MILKIFVLIAAMTAASAEEAAAPGSAIQGARMKDFIIGGQTFNGFTRGVVKFLIEEYADDHELMSKKWFKDQKYFWKGNKVEKTRAKKQHRANLKYVRKIANEQAYCALMELPEGQVWAMDKQNVDWLLGRNGQVSDCGVYTDDTHVDYFKNSEEYGAMVLLEFTQIVGQDVLSKGWKRGSKKAAKKAAKGKKMKWTQEEMDLFQSYHNYQSPQQTTSTFTKQAATSGRRLFNWNSHNANSASSTCVGGTCVRARAWANLGGGQCPSAGFAVDYWNNAYWNCYWYWDSNCGWWGCYRRRCNLVSARWSQAYSYSMSLCTVCFSSWGLEMCLSIHQDADCGGGNVGGCRIAGNGNACTSGSNCNAHGFKVTLELPIPFTDPFSLYCDAGMDFGHHLFLCNGR